MRTFFLFPCFTNQICFAQKIVSVKPLFTIYKEGTFFEEVNASLYMPPSYAKVEHFIYEDEKVIDNGDGTVTVPYISREIAAARRETHPIRKLGHSHVYFEKGNILIASQVSWITLSSFYTYSNGNIDEDEQLQKHRYNFVHSPELYGLGNTYTLLGKLDNEKTRAINADDVFIYKSNQTFSYKSAQPNYGSIIVNFLKYDLGRVSLVFYYPLNEYKKVLKEVKKTWGTVRFKKDNEFIPPKRERDLKPDLYFGKFSYLNNEDQEIEERDSYLRRIGAEKK